MIVADTNLVVFAALNGPRTASAALVRQQEPHWAAPPLWASEFRNVLATTVRAGHLTAADAHEAWAAARTLVEDIPVDPLAVLDAAFAHGLTGYDAEFVALARALGVPLVTDDRRVLAACPDVAVAPDAFAGDAG